MRKFLISLAFLLGATQSAQAQQNALMSLETGNDMRGWEAVGRLDIEGKGFCTATLIADNLVLTAAHCMFDANGGDMIEPSRFAFQAGLRNGRPEATRAVRSLIVHPEYPNIVDTTSQIVRYDVALLQLDRPIRPSEIVPFPIADSLSDDVAIGVVSYAQNRADSPSLQRECNVLGQQQGALIMSCDIDFGASGSPVFRIVDGVPRLVSVFSAMAEVNGEVVALGTDLAGPLADLQAEFAASLSGLPSPPTQVRVMRQGERNETGALFVRP